MDKNKIEELIKKLYSNNFNQNDVLMYFNGEYENFPELLKYLEETFGYNHKTIHFYIIFLETFLKSNSTLPQNSAKIIAYIFENLSKIAEENLYINSFINNFGYEKFLFSDKILHLISGFDISKFDNIVKIRLIKGFILNYNEGILLRNYKDFFKNILLDLVENNIKNLANLRLNFENLINYFSFTISEAVIIINRLEENGINNNFYTKSEAGLINSLGEENFINELNKLNELDSIIFINSIKSYLDFLAIKDFSGLNNNIIFYLSLIYSRRLFDLNKTNAFFDYYLDLIKKENLSIMKYINQAKSLDIIIDFLKNNNVNFFENKKFAKSFFTRIFGELIYSHSIISIIKANKEYFLINFEFILEIIVSVQFENNKINLFSDIVYALLEIVIERGDLNKFISFIDIGVLGRINFEDSSNIQRVIGLLAKFGNYDLLKYKEIEKIILFIVKCNLVSSYSFSSFVELLSNGNQKCRYILGKNLKLIKNKLSNYDLKKVKEKVFQSRSFPFIIYHFIRYVLE